MITRADFPLRNFQLSLPPSFCAFNKNALDEAFHERWHVAAPQWKDEHDMIAIDQRLARCGKIGFEWLLAPIAFAQNRVKAHLC